MKSMKEILAIGTEMAGEGYEDLKVEERWAESKAIMAKLYNVPIEHFNKGREKARAKAKKEEPSPQMDLFDDA